MMVVREVAEILGYLAAAFPKHEMPEETVRVWCDQFASLDYGVAQRAAKRVVADDEWFPTIARFREVVATELKFRGDNTFCGDCDRGFIIKGRNEAAYCPTCRPQAVFAPGERLELGRGDGWENGVEAARGALKKI